MNLSNKIARLLCLALLLTLIHSLESLAQPHYYAAKQGCSMRIQMMNVGSLGKIAYPPFTCIPPNTPPESLGKVQTRKILHAR